MENLRINEKIKQNLLTGAKWLKFLIVLACVIMVLYFILAIFCCFLPNNSTGLSGLALAFIYLLVIALYIYPLKKSFELVRNIRSSMNNGDQDSLDQAAENFCSILKYTGILTILSIIFCIIFIIIMLIVTATVLA